MAGIHETAIIGKDCVIPNSVTIGENCVLGDRVILHENVVLYPNTKIGNDTEIFDNTVIGRSPKSAGNLVHKLNSEFGAVKIGNNCVIGCDVVLYAESIYGNNVLIGDGVKIRENALIEDFVLIAMNCTLNHHVTMKKGSKVMDLSHITARTVIGEEVFVGALVATSNDNKMRIRGSEVGTTNIIHMESGSKIGSGAIILPNVTVGNNSIVGAGSVVTKDVNDNLRVMGIPAKEK